MDELIAEAAAALLALTLARAAVGGGAIPPQEGPQESCFVQGNDPTPHR